MKAQLTYVQLFGEGCSDNYEEVGDTGRCHADSPHRLQMEHALEILCQSSQSKMVNLPSCDLRKLSFVFFLSFSFLVIPFIFFLISPLSFLLTFVSCTDCSYSHVNSQHMKYLFYFFFNLPRQTYVLAPKATPPVSTLQKHIKLPSPSLYTPLRQSCTMNPTDNLQISLDIQE